MKFQSTLLLSTVLFVAASLSVTEAVPLPGLRTSLDPITLEKRSLESITARGLRTSLDPITTEKRSSRDVEARGLRTSVDPKATEKRSSEEVETRGLRTSVDPVTTESKDVPTSGDVSAACGYRWYANFRQCI
ncbi:hypothetical protein BGZ75_007849 [Mortierella antarctica]|nr:hypothetical protein BGZ67_010723 [Mortierella alpina]KAF9980916.1 hypothetical protein BGZ75_007849 [Mortierella antarctica]